MAALFLIRHAEPAVKGVFLGQLDPLLSPAGHAQAQRVLSNLQVKIAYVSPLRRARETASYLRSAQVIVLPELQEIDFGEWTGKTWQQIQTSWPELASQKLKGWLGITPPGGESWESFACRVHSAWDRIRSGPSPAAVVAHEGVNAALASIIDGRSPLNFSQAYTGITSIEYTTD
ncbi:MAG: histidine phosphatase family protein [Bryobacteraceae bacterium]